MSTPTGDSTLLYGLRVHSELPLHQRHQLDGGPPDVTIRIGRTIPGLKQPPEGTMLLDLELDRRMYCATRHEDGHYTFRCHGVCDFVISADLGDVTVHMMEGGAADVAAVLATGALLSFILAMHQQAVLHASAVQVGDFVVAFVGMSGMGKSTLAALMCADGAVLVTDDVLRLDLDSDGLPTCFTGATELRLRKGANELAARFSDAVATRHTGDGRHALRLPASDDEHLPLRCIVIPRPRHDGSQSSLTVEILEPKDALLALIQFPRLLGWQDPEVLRRHFHELGHITSRVPVYVATMPWGPPFPDDIATQLLAAVAPQDPGPTTDVQSVQRPSSGPR